MFALETCFISSTTKSIYKYIYIFIYNIDICVHAITNRLFIQCGTISVNPWLDLPESPFKPLEAGKCPFWKEHP